MTFELKWTHLSLQQYANLKSDPAKKEEFRKIQRTLGFLQTNLRHPSLNTHEYSRLENPYDPNKKVFEAYAENVTPGAYRIFWCYGPERSQITIVAITPHP